MCVCLRCSQITMITNCRTRCMLMIVQTIVFMIVKVITNHTSQNSFPSKTKWYGKHPVCREADGIYCGSQTNKPTEPVLDPTPHLLPELLWNNGQEIVEARCTTTLARQHMISTCNREPMWSRGLGGSLRGVTSLSPGAGKARWLREETHDRIQPIHPCTVQYGVNCLGP